ncbi:probable ADP-ribosylation factor GTPase-activating protein AGD14 [Cucurbita maxima]|uniref:Probable ADP-ribosylation factor GTPase-activating protein AGD14 n=1 Tax=Cucurbita maxima TaxID=3661 RepID=A0A6J1HM50_CUCMA|nr:probable ADP-ribosylation factor GTPase-activating protein AGD14 [Cucurbita maxima]XP_022965601.1 probable ADP-ribosylation factor GTPase-activating protein AGD14 [Cucurbita maxima]
MANRVKEDEKNERIIRGLLKLQENRRCINCNSLGPQYVCTNFWTFVCTTCSGIHREFTHRVKSISMAKFTSQEVSALQEGGNQRAREIYFKELDPQRHSFPDSSNVMRLRDFIKHVYVDRRYSGDKNFDKPPRVKSGEKEDYNENRRTDTYRGGSRSPPYEDRRYNERSSPGGRNFDGRRSPGSDHENRQFGDFMSPSRPEVVNDWRREDRFGNGKRVEDARSSDGDSKIGGRSPEQPNDLDASSPPMVRPVRDILGENVSPLRVIEPPKISGGSKAADSSVHKQRTASSSSLGSISESVVETKLEPSGSLIDFDAEPEPIASAVPQPPQSSAPQSVTHAVNTNSDNNWASFDVPQAPPAPASAPAPANVGTLESVLSQLSVSASVPGVSGSHGAVGAVPTAPVSNMTMLPSGFDPSFGSGGNTLMPPPFAGGAPSAAPGTGLSTFPPSGQWSNMQSQTHSLFPGGNSQPGSQQFPPSIDRSINQPWNASLSANSQGPLSNPAAHAPPPQDFSSPAQGTASGVPQTSALEVKPSGRKELPADLFALNYSSYPAPVPGWHTIPPRPMGYVMPYNSPMPMPSFPQPSISTNPFDLSSEQSQFPSMAPLQNALPSGQPGSNLVRTPGYGNPASAWIPQQPPSNLSHLPPQASYPSTMHSRPPYMGQQVASNVQPYRHPGLGNYGNEGVAHGYTDMSQQTAGRFPAPATPNPFSSTGGNPFG